MIEFIALKHITNTNEQNIRIILFLYILNHLRNRYDNTPKLRIHRPSTKDAIIIGERVR